MRCRWCAGFGVLSLMLIAAVRPAFAEAATVRIMRPLDLVALPLVVMQHEHLIERVAEQMNLGAVTVEWQTPGKTAPIEALAAGQTDLAATDIASLLLAADNTAGKPEQPRALAALTERPYVLVARKPGIATIRDFGPGDHIAVPALKTSGPALMLEMAAAQEWGIEHYDKLDPLLVARSDEAASEELQSGKGGLDAHFSQSPYADDELVNAAIHRVMDSFDIAGPHTVEALAVTAHFHDANPQLCIAVLSALEQADDLIKKGPGRIAEMYASMIKDQDIAVEDLTDMIGEPDLAYRAAPAGVMRLTQFMQRVGRLKRAPGSWKELFIPEAQDLPGS